MSDDCPYELIAVSAGWDADMEAFLCDRCREFDDQCTCDDAILMLVT